MHPTLTVRAVTTDDAAVLAAHEPHPGVIDGHLSQVGDDYLFLAAWNGETPMGWAALDTREHDLRPELVNMFVIPEQRRKGTGKALTSEFEARAKEAGYTEIFLIVDPVHETFAIPMYLDLDYTPTGDHRIAEVVETGEKTHQAIYRKSLTIRA